MNKIRKGDEVIVLTGRDKGKRGTVALRVDDEHLIVEGVNVVKKHTKPNPMKGTTGGIVDKTHADPPVERRDLQRRPPARPTASASSARRTSKQVARLQVAAAKSDRAREQG